MALELKHRDESALGLLHEPLPAHAAWAAESERQPLASGRSLPVGVTPNLRAFV